MMIVPVTRLATCSRFMAPIVSANAVLAGFLQKSLLRRRRDFHLPFPGQRLGCDEVFGGPLVLIHHVDLDGHSLGPRSSERRGRHARVTKDRPPRPRPRLRERLRRPLLSCLSYNGAGAGCLVLGGAASVSVITRPQWRRRNTSHSTDGFRASVRLNAVYPPCGGNSGGLRRCCW